jgi:hypothetical protein
MFSINSRQLLLLLVLLLLPPHRIPLLYQLLLWQRVNGDVQVSFYAGDKVDGLFYGWLDHHQLTHPGGQPISNTYHLAASLHSPQQQQQQQNCKAGKW